MRVKTLFLVPLLLFGCKSVQYVPVETTHTDTLIITKQQRDSIWQHDSIYLHEWMSADTVYVLKERWHTKYIEKEVRDTTYISKTDSVPVPYSVERQLTAWQAFKVKTGGVLLGVTSLGLLVLIGGIVRKLKG